MKVKTRKKEKGMPRADEVGTTIAFGPALQTRL